MCTDHSQEVRRTDAAVFRDTTITFVVFGRRFVRDRIFTSDESPTSRTRRQKVEKVLCRRGPPTVRACKLQRTAITAAIKMAKNTWEDNAHGAVVIAKNRFRVGANHICIYSRIAITPNSVVSDPLVETNTALNLSTNWHILHYSSPRCRLKSKNIYTL